MVLFCENNGRLPSVESSMQGFLSVIRLLRRHVMPRDKAMSFTDHQSLPFISKGGCHSLKPHHSFGSQCYSTTKVQRTKFCFFSQPCLLTSLKARVRCPCNLFKVNTAWSCRLQKTHIYYLQCLRLHYFQMHQIGRGKK